MGDRSSSRVGVVRSRAVARRSRTNLVIARRVLDGLVAGRGLSVSILDATGTTIAATAVSRASTMAPTSPWQKSVC